MHSEVMWSVDARMYGDQWWWCVVMSAPGGVHLAVLVGVDEGTHGRRGGRGGRGERLHGAAAADWRGVDSAPPAAAAPRTGARTVRDYTSRASRSQQIIRYNFAEPDVDANQ